MTHSKTFRSGRSIIAGLLIAIGATSAIGQINPAVMPASGPLTKQTMSRLLLTDGTRVGDRVVAVGDRGYIVYSDNNGASWQRAKTPPNTPLLTAVYFLDAKTGWAVGHDSMILTSTDRGETWTKSFAAVEEQKPLMDITFVDAQTGFAVGAYGAFHATTDGGKAWTPRKMFEGAKAVAAPVAVPKKGKYESVGGGKDAKGGKGGKGDEADADDKAGKGGGDEDKHINAIVKLGENKLFVAGEAGLLAKSDDGGKSWIKIASPYKGSFFGAIQAQDGAVVIYGLRGRIYRSTDAALSNWKQIDNKSVASLMGSTRLADGTLALAGLSGTLLISRDNGNTFSAQSSGSTKALSAPLQGAANVWLLIGEAGVRDVAMSALAPAAPAAEPATTKPKA